MEQMLARVWEDLIGRTEGPMKLRLLLQPLMASIFAVRSGLRDARAGKPPFLFAVANDPARRWELFREGRKDVGTVFVLAVVLDVVYQVIELHTFYPVETLLVAILLALVPYLLVRPVVTRLARGKGP